MTRFTLESLGFAAFTLSVIAVVLAVRKVSGDRSLGAMSCGTAACLVGAVLAYQAIPLEDTLGRRGLYLALASVLLGPFGAVLGSLKRGRPS